MNLEQAVEHKPFSFRGRQITSGKAMSPLRGIIYGDNGIGKTTFASSGKNPIIFDMEGNCGHIDAEKIRITNLDDVHDFLDDLLTQDHDYKTLVIDSLDSLQVLLTEKISQRHSPQELSFGKSAAIWAKYIKDITSKLETLSSSKGMNVLFTAHWKVKQANNPMVENYDRYDLRINEEMRTGFCNWVQFIILATKDVIIEEKDGGYGKKKAKDIERRILHTRGSPAYYGKNVFDLPAKIAMDWDQLISNVKNFYSK